MLKYLSINIAEKSVTNKQIPKKWRKELSNSKYSICQFLNPLIAWQSNYYYIDLISGDSKHAMKAQQA